MGFVKPWPDLEGGGDSSLFYPGESAPGPKSLPCHRTIGTKDREHHELVFIRCTSASLGQSRRKELIS